MGRNEDVRFTSSPIKVPRFPKTRSLPHISALPFAGNELLLHIRRARESIHRFVSSVSARAWGRTSLLCSSSLALSRPEQEHNPRRPQYGKDGEERVLVSEVLIRNKDGEVLELADLEAAAANAIRYSRNNSALTVREVQEDVHRIIDSGLFCSCMPVAVDTRDGIRLVFQVEPNQDFHGLICEGANVLPSKFLEDAFRGGYGKIVNIRHLDKVIKSINGWYIERGLFGMVSDVEILSGGILRLQVSEAEVNNIIIRFLDRKTGEPTEGRTKTETILRQLTTKKGQVYSLLQGRRDVDTILTMGIMEDVTIIPQPSSDGRNVDLVMNLVERPSGGFSAGGGISSGITNGPLSGLIGSFAYSHRNVFGRNQKLNLSLERGQIDSIFRINYSDPWISGDDKRTSRTIMIQNSRTPGTLVHGGQQYGHSGLTIGRVTAGIEFSRPLRPQWSGTAGIIFQHAGARDDKGNPLIRDIYNCPLTASGNAYDQMLISKLEGVYTGSSDRGSSMFSFNVEQGIPVLSDWLCFNRVTARARQSVEVGPLRFLLSLSGGHVVGSFCPHEAFAIGGTNSVRGYEEGAVGSGRSYVVGSAESSFRLFGPVEVVLFGDYGTDLGSGSTVPGDPAGARGKPGFGHGFGSGIRVDSPLGPLRLEYALNDKLARRFHFGEFHFLASSSCPNERGGAWTEAEGSQEMIDVGKDRKGSFVFESSTEMDTSKYLCQFTTLLMDTVEELTMRVSQIEFVCSQRFPDLQSLSHAIQKKLQGGSMTRDLEWKKKEDSFLHQIKQLQKEKQQSEEQINQLQSSLEETKEKLMNNELLLNSRKQNEGIISRLEEQLAQKANEVAKAKEREKDLLQQIELKDENLEEERRKRKSLFGECSKIKESYKRLKSQYTFLTSKLGDGRTNMHKNIREDTKDNKMNTPGSIVHPKQYAVNDQIRPTNNKPSCIKDAVASHWRDTRARQEPREETHTMIFSTPHWKTSETST
ncbi:hypothetical protein HPP92_006144 [Vanilla planifolia]|uniref:POTRA domain-containing protein n=1 Tax=Vanilla planifolia TaxID=51239 RepID=A0A835VDU5_VANPL|nr:hypothetical protein HPP92_006144 [Vanilla planifolia]